MKLAAILLSLILCSPAGAAWTMAGGTSNEHVIISDNAVLDNADSDWTWAFMWKQDSWPGGTDRVLLSNNDSPTGNPAFYIYCSASSGPGNLSTRNNNATTDQIATSSFQECTTTGTWRRYIVTHSGDVMNVYLDNVLVATSTDTVGTSDGPAGGLYIGIEPSGTNENSMTICDIAKWTRVLSSSERASLTSYSAAMYPNSRTLFIPAIREFVERQVPLTVTNQSATITACPSLIRPG